MPQFEPRKKENSSTKNGKRNDNNNRRNFQNENNAETSQGNSRNRRYYNPRQQNHKINMKKYEKMIENIQNNFSDIAMSGHVKDDCSICCKPCDIFGVTECRHPVCIECTLRLRVLNGQKACPICRMENEIIHLMFTSNDLGTCNLLSKNFGSPAENRYGLRFENKDVAKRYDQYLSHVCKICTTQEGDRLEFNTFTALRCHMANTHNLTYCQICTDNLQLFSRERKTYDRSSLQQHIQKGDDDEIGQRGHPTCLFCSERFYDNEGQYKHLRKEHYFCQFCESDGTMTNAFFNKHEELIGHYKAKHFLCTHEDCQGLGIAFSNKNEFNLHQTHHSGKSVPLEFSYNNRQLMGRGRIRTRDDQSGNQISRPPMERIAVLPMPVNPPPPPPPNTEIVVVPSAQSSNRSFIIRNGTYTHRAEDFPTLPGAPSNNVPQVVVPEAFPRLKKANPTKAPTARAVAPKSMAEEFPTLDGQGSREPQGNGWKGHTGNFEVIDDDEQAGSVSRSYLPQSVLDPPRPGQMVQKKKPLTQRETFFSSLKANKEKQPETSTSSWAARTKGNSAITGVVVPKKKPVAMPDFIPDRSTTTPASEYQPTEEVWENVPFNRKLTWKERKELEKKQATAESLEQEAIFKEIQEKMNEEPDEDLEMQAILMNDIASSSGNTSAEASQSSNNSRNKIDLNKVSAQLPIRRAVPTNQTENKKKKTKTAEKNAEKKPEFPTLEATKNSPTKASRKNPIKANAVEISKPEDTEGGGLSSWLFSSMTNALGGLSLSNILGERSQPLVSLETKPLETKIEKKVEEKSTYPPGFELSKDESPISFAAPPGFENFLPPPGLSRPEIHNKDKSSKRS